jgi:uncharacterized membrane protein
MSLLVRAALLGAATGGRSMAGIAAVALTTPPGADPAWLGSRWGRIGATAGALGELVGDKLPTTPSRMEPLPLAGRIGCGALAAFLLAQRSGQPSGAPVLAAAAGAVGGAVLGRGWRGLAKRRGRPDLPAALAEDAVVYAVAVTAAAV